MKNISLNKTCGHVLQFHLIKHWKEREILLYFVRAVLLCPVKLMFQGSFEMSVPCFLGNVFHQSTPVNYFWILNLKRQFLKNMSLMLYHQLPRNAQLFVKFWDINETNFPTGPIFRLWFAGHSHLYTFFLFCQWVLAAYFPIHQPSITNI